MHGWIYRRHGGPEVLEWIPLESRAPGEGEIAVRVVAAALNPLDWKLRAGQFRLMAKSPPRGTGYDYAGTVEAVGPGAADFAPGDAVVGLVHPMNSRDGTMAERLVAPAALAVRKPAGLSFADAASLPGAGITAAQALREAGLAKGQRVLVVGASGGVGAFAVLIARHAGAHVTAVASTDGQAFLVGLAPDRAIDYRKEDWRRIAGPFDLVFDASGTSRFGDVATLLAPKGGWIHALPGPGLYIRSWWHRLKGGPRVLPVMVRPNRPDLEFLARETAAGRLRSVVTRVATPPEVPALQAEMAAGHNRGKLVVRFLPEP